MIKRQKEFFFSFRIYVHYTMMKTEKQVFLNLVTTFTTPSSKEKKRFFFVYSLRSLHHDQESKKFFIPWVTTFTTPWSTEKKVFFSFSLYVHYTRIKREKEFFFFSFSHYVHYTMIKREKEVSFQLATTFTTPWSREKKGFF